MIKQYVKITATFDCDGNLIPEFIYWDENKKYPIDKSTNININGIKMSINDFFCFISGGSEFIRFILGFSVVIKSLLIIYIVS